MYHLNYFIGSILVFIHSFFGPALCFYDVKYDVNNLLELIKLLDNYFADYHDHDSAHQCSSITVRYRRENFQERQIQNQG